MDHVITNNYSLPQAVVDFAQSILKSREHMFKDVFGEIRIHSANAQDHPGCTKMHCDVTALNNKKHRLVIIFDNTTGSVVKAKIGPLLGDATTITS